jgi:hypothetical protein
MAERRDSGAEAAREQQRDTEKAREEMRRLERER